MAKVLSTNELNRIRQDQARYSMQTDTSDILGFMATIDELEAENERLKAALEGK